ncbi:AAA family ATPase [Anaerovibrio sp. RM50]|uniref:AAA family ATPase n=1 Tax=Anaerovibrio sp. RM50 TaxID=1200557 RepID=UPI000687E029|nr:AAA family ATPase [Anaerovibrio sp. RM50]
MMADKMSKKIKFALIMHGHEVRTMTELQKRFSLGDMLDDFMDLREEGEESKLCEWLSDRYLYTEAKKIGELQEEWAGYSELSEEKMAELVERIQDVFLPKDKFQQKKSREEIRNYVLLTKTEFESKVARITEYLENESVTDGLQDCEYDADMWRKYLARLAWNNKSLSELKAQKKVKKIYLLRSPQKDEMYNLTLKDFENIYFVGVRDKNGKVPRIKITQGREFISEEKWNSTNKKEYRNIKIYLENDKGELKEWHEEKSKEVVYSSKGSSEGEAKKQLARYMDAQYPLIYFKTYEEDKADEIIREIAAGKRILEWSVEGFFDKNPKTENINHQRNKPLDDTLNMLIRQCDTYANIVDKKAIYMKNAVLVLKDVHELLKDHTIAAQLKYLAQLIYKGSLEECNIIIVSPLLVIPKEIEHYMVLLEFSHLADEEINDLVNEFCAGQSKLRISDTTKSKLKIELRGLTEFQIVNILGLAYAGDGEINEDDLKQITEQKKQIIRKRGLLEIVDVKVKKDEIGGLDNLKEWLEKKGQIFHNWQEAEKCGVALPKGILIAGMPGCGKSLCAKATATIFGEVTLLRMDMGRMMGKYVGESEENMRHALKQADDIAPCVLWIDEIEKAFAGVGGDGSGADVATRLLGTFLTWMQEKRSKTFVVATANNINLLPPELLRKGRFDDVFYVDLPTYDERVKILEIHIKKKYEKDISNNNIKIEDLAKEMDGYSGAEIEGIVLESIENAFIRNAKEKEFENDDNREIHLSTDDIRQVRKKTKSLKEMRPEAIKELRKIYGKNNFKNATKLIPEKTKRGDRFVSIWWDKLIRG